jgi:uncharacterized protein DUF397
MSTLHAPGPAWTKSSHSNGQANCVEVSRSTPGIVAVRDSKNPAGPVLTITPGAWRHLLAAITGEHPGR